MQAGRRGILLAIAVVGLSGILGGVYGAQVESTVAGDSEIQRAIRQFTKVYAIIEQNAADPVDPDRAIFQGAIPEMLRALDPHSGFFDSRAFSLLREEQQGHYHGVGMQVAPREGRTIIVAPFVGSPAYKAGLRPGDIIFRVDGIVTEGLSTPEVADLLKGPKGTVVQVEVLREGVEEPLAFTITRDEIPRLSVEYYFEIQPHVAYIRLASFNETTREELEDALNQLGPDNLQGLVLDLRGNPGGLLNQAVQVADLFLDKNQLIVSHHGRNQRERSYRARGGNQGHGYPLVILIDRFSASAAEIVAGAVQDHDRGLIVGENSFGKGLVQTVYPLSHNTGLALTSARYYTPSGRLIQRDYRSVSLYSYYYGSHRNGNTLDAHRTDGGRTVFGGGGITPDVEVSLPELNDFQQELLRQVILYPSNIGVGDFARRYLARHQDVGRDFEVTPAVLDDFRRFLSEKGVRYTEPDIQDNLDWLKIRIKREIFTTVFGRDEGHRVEILADPQVQRAIQLLPEARELAENTRRVIARKQQKR